MTSNQFDSLNLDKAILENLESLAYHQMTEIQAQSLPSIIDGKDVIAQGQTGSGKTAAFSLGLLHKLDTTNLGVQGLILCPTRELADQVAKEVRRLARCIANTKVLTLCGGMPFTPQVNSLKHGSHIIVGTPGRVEEHLRKGHLRLNTLNSFVLDEADRMLDMGFQEALEEIISYLPSSRQTLLFSATYPDEIKGIAKKLMRSPVTVTVESQHDSNTIEQHFYGVKDDNERLLGVKLLLSQFRPKSAVVFCSTKKATVEVANDLLGSGFSALALNGDLDQRQREQALIRFAHGSVVVLVATDVAARGLDIDALDMVINYHISQDPEVHVHRIGRTGRAGSSGMACSLISDKESYKVACLGEYLDMEIEAMPLPSMNALNKPPVQAKMASIRIDGGKKQKVRAGDIVGALTSAKLEPAIAGNQVGKIDVFDNWAFVAVEKALVKQAANKISKGKIKGRRYRAQVLKN